MTKCLTDIVYNVILGTNSKQKGFDEE